MGGTQNKTEDVGIRLIVPYDLPYDEGSCGEKAGYPDVLGLTHQRLRHLIVDATAEISEGAVLFGGVGAVYHVVALIQLIYQLIHLVNGYLSVVVHRDGNVTRTEAVTRHESGVLTEILCEFHTLQLGIFGAHLPDNRINVIGRGVAYHDHLVIVPSLGNRINYLFNYRPYRILTSVAGNNKGYLHILTFRYR